MIVPVMRPTGVIHRTSVEVSGSLQLKRGAENERSENGQPENAGLEIARARPGLRRTTYLWIDP